MMTFSEWADRTFGSGFKEEEMITYFRMSAAWNAARNECAADIENLGGKAMKQAADILRSNVELTGPRSVSDAETGGCCGSGSAQG